MPIALDPNATFKIVLESDEVKPKSERPRFVYHHLTARQWGQIVDVLGNLETTENSEVMNKVFDACRIGLAGWENIKDLSGKPIAFRPKAMEDILTLAEATELLVMLSAAGLSGDSKKKFVSPSDSGTARSAKTAKVRRRARTRRVKARK